MSRLAIPSLDQAPAASQPILQAVGKQLGAVPNLFRLLGSSPAALAALTGLDAANAKSLNLKTRTGIAIAVAQVNGCAYCLSAHTYIGLNLAKISAQEAALNRRGQSADPRIAAALRFAAEVARRRGKVSDADLGALRAAGYSDAETVEIVSVVAQNFLTNLLNNVAETDIDFPVVSPDDLADAA